MLCFLFSFLRFSSLRNQLTVTLVVSLLLPTVFGNCTNDSDCIFGTCDQDYDECQCDLNCNHASYFQHIVCSERTCDNQTGGCTWVNSVCYEATEECVIGTKYVFKRITELNFLTFSQNCSAVLQSDRIHEERLCDDQSYCSGNGICVEKISTEEKECICNDQHTGQRCDIIKPPTNSVSQQTMFMKTLNKQKQRKSMLPSSTISSSTVLVVLGVASPCMIIGIVFIKRQRRVNELTPITKTLDYETETTGLKTVKDPPSEEMNNSIDNRNDPVSDFLQTVHFSEPIIKDFDTVVTICNEKDNLIGTCL